MKNNFLPISAFTIGICLSVISLLSNQDQVLNHDDTYYVIRCKDFSGLLFSIFVIMSITYFSIQKYCNRRIGILQIVAFSVSIIYFLIYDLITEPFSPGYSYANPISFKFGTIYIPLVFLFVFLSSLILFVANIIIAIIKRIRAST